MHSKDPQLAVIRLPGSTLDSQAVEALALQVSQADATTVVIDASSLTETRLQGLAALLAWAVETRQRAGTRLVLAGPSRPLLRAICQTRLQRELDVYSNLGAALRDVGGP